MRFRRPYRSRGRTRLVSAGLARRSCDLGAGCDRKIAPARTGGRGGGMSEQPRLARLLCAAAACCLVLTSAMLIEAPTFADTAGILNPTPLNTTDGRQIYEHVCQGCHMPDAGGAVGAGHYPSLANNPALASRQYMALRILMGRRNMPAFGAKHAIG